jgi:WD40 repeat protein
MITLFFFSQDQKVRLYNWDGKGLQEAAVLEANRGLVSVLAFSPDGLKLAAGDVSTPSNLIAIFFMADFFHHDLAKKKPFRLVTPCVGVDRF